MSDSVPPSNSRAVVGWAIVRMRLDRGRYAEWDRDLRGLADNDGRTNNNA